MSAKTEKESTSKKKRSNGRAKADGPDRVLEFAESLAESTEQDETQQRPEQLETWVTCRMAGDHVAFLVDYVQEIIRPETITRVPHAPYPVRGILNLRGRVIPVVDLRLRLGLPRQELDSHSRVAVTSIRQRTLGLLVDSVEQVVTIDRLSIESPPDDVMTEQSGYIIGVHDHDGTLLILLDAEQVLMVPDGLQEANAHAEQVAS